MNIVEMSERQLAELCIKALLKSRPMSTEELQKALSAFWNMCIDACLVQMVVAGDLAMSWNDGQLQFGPTERTQ